MSVAIYVYPAGANLKSEARKTLIYPRDFGADPDAARLLGEDIVNLVDEFDGEDLDMVLEFRADPDAQRSLKDGIFR
jgi:hypothetical protein